MIKIVFIWLFCIGMLADSVIVLIKLLDWISWGWGIIIAIPFALAIVGTLAFAILYGIIKIFVAIATML